MREKMKSFVRSSPVLFYSLAGLPACLLTRYSSLSVSVLRRQWTESRDCSALIMMVGMRLSTLDKTRGSAAETVGCLDSHPPTHSLSGRVPPASND
jgi:hypothetical protein